ncbi:MAG TPA: hypothetical protein VKU41_24915 [Polyangiaceae bacterium]|nr:hypothetical protein [Polyangiaceae bacterium]
MTPPRAIVAAVTLLAAASACRSRPAAGEKCRVPDQLVCTATNRALVCNGATWSEVPCKGPRGCMRAGDADECDDTLAVDGDLCPRNPPLDYACTADRTKALVCKEGKFGLWRACRGPDACQIVGDRSLHCDTTLGAPGDPCAQQGTYACSVDGTLMLLCDGSALGPVSSCRGPEGCHIERDSRKVDCDDAVALEGDPCDQPNRITCAIDRKAELVCDGKRYARKRDCRKTDCRVTGTELFCD